MPWVTEVLLVVPDKTVLLVQAVLLEVPAVTEVTESTDRKEHQD